ncbi:MAG: hypothetical protein IJ642_09985 [Oscillospiraceae bacterium]|nr:hypothetical protein [Oscillospiraceae bacterium]
MAKKKSFILFIDRKKELAMLNNEQAGILFKAVMEYADTGEELVSDDLGVRMLFSVFQSQIDSTMEKYEEKCQRNKQIAIEREARKKEARNSTDVHERDQTYTKSTYTDTETETDTFTDTVTHTDIDTDTDTISGLTDKPIKNEKVQSPFSKPMLFPVVLYHMQSPLCEDGYDSEEELSGYDCEDRCCASCAIPQNFKHHVGTMEQALQYLTGFSNIKDQDFKQIVSGVITALSETICTGMSSMQTAVDSDLLISRLNQIIAQDDNALLVWVQDFSYHYQKKLQEKISLGQEIRNRYGFLKACAVSFLTEYKAGDFIPRA